MPVTHRLARIFQRSWVFLLAFGPNADAARGADFGNLRDQYVKTFLRRFPVVATYLGAEGLDPLLISVNGTLRDYSPSGLENERKEWVRFQRELLRFDRRALPEEDRIDTDGWPRSSHSCFTTWIASWISVRSTSISRSHFAASNGFSRE